MNFAVFSSLYNLAVKRHFCDSETFLELRFTFTKEQSNLKVRTIHIKFAVGIHRRTDKRSTRLFHIAFWESRLHRDERAESQNGSV